MPRSFVIGDIHGACRALDQCLDRAGFDPLEDRLVCLGDVCDGWPQTREAIDRLLQLKHLVYLLGNHDTWALKWMQEGDAPDIWLRQGGDATVRSYPVTVPEAHKQLLTRALFYYSDDRHRLFTHAGFDPQVPLSEQDPDVFLWDRNLARMALDFYLKGIDAQLAPYDETYIGHTPIPFEKPICSCGVWLMDTGAGWEGRLSMLDLDSKTLYQSDPVPELYPGVPGRKRSG